MNDLLTNSPNDIEIFNSLSKAVNVLSKFDVIAVAISGGADSDIVIDMIEKAKAINYTEVNYVFFDTGFEFDATRRQLDYLEKRYNVTIDRYKGKHTIPNTVRRYGKPFISKFTSRYIKSLKKHNFNFREPPASYEEAIAKYPGTKTALMWFYNQSPNKYVDGKLTAISYFNIDRKKYLRDFLIEHPPDDIDIANNCCLKIKEFPAEEYVRNTNSELLVTGVRKAEQGPRSMAYKGCFDYNIGSISYYRPIFFFNKEQVDIYNDHYNIKHSDCYTIYGLKRTGCVGCPYNINFEEELKVIEKYEPKLLKPAFKIFGDSYEYTRKYYEYRKNREGSNDPWKE